MSCRKIVNNKKYQTRPSPPYRANDCQYKIMVGNNGKDYISRPNKNGLFKWYPIVNGKTPEEYYSQFQDAKSKQYEFPTKILKKINDELNDKNIMFYHIGWNKVWNMVDNAWDDAELLAEKSKIVKNIRKLDKKSFTTELVSFIFYTENGRYFSEIDGNLFMQHNILRKDRTTAINIFTKYFGKNFVWNGKNNKAFSIKLRKIPR